MPDESLRIIGEYSRSRDGKTIHLNPCARQGAAVPWIYANHMSLHEVVATVKATAWLRLCRACWPGGALEEESR